MQFKPSLALEIWSFTVYFYGKRRSLLHPNTAQGSFFPLQSYSKKTLRKNVPKSARKYKRNVLMPPEHPIILLKSNEFNMAVVSVKRSITSSREKRFLLAAIFLGKTAGVTA